MIKLNLNSEYASARLALMALRVELERVALLEFDPGAVPGSVLVDFNRHWPDGWYWDTEGLWDEDDKGNTSLERGRLYDTQDWFLVDDDGAEEELSSFIQRFIEGQGTD